MKHEIGEIEKAAETVRCFYTSCHNQKRLLYSTVTLFVRYANPQKAREFKEFQKSIVYLIRYAIIRLNFLESIDFMVFMSYSVPNLNSLQIQCNYLLHNFFSRYFFGVIPVNFLKAYVKALCEEYPSDAEISK